MPVGAHPGQHLATVDEVTVSVANNSGPPRAASSLSRTGMSMTAFWRGCTVPPPWARRQEARYTIQAPSDFDDASITSGSRS